MTRRYSIIALVGLICIAASAFAQDGINAIYDEGSLSFDYDQWPIGNYDGSFDASGAILDSLLWGNEQTMSCGGTNQIFQDTTVVWCYGAIYNADTTVDLAAVFVRSVGEVTPGNYSVDVSTFMAGYAFFDDVANFTVPDPNGDVATWLSNLSAAHRMVSSAGNIIVSAVSDTEFAGTFSGTMIDADNVLLIVTVSAGVFNMTGGPYTVGLPQDAPGVIAQHGNFPNPFNPKTRVSFTLAEASDLLVTVHDASGRKVDTLFEGWGEAGKNELDWHGHNADGRALPAGLYLYRIVGNHESARGKMLLLP